MGGTPSKTTYAAAIYGTDQGQTWFYTPDPSIPDIIAMECAAAGGCTQGQVLQKLNAMITIPAGYQRPPSGLQFLIDQPT